MRKSLFALFFFVVLGVSAAPVFAQHHMGGRGGFMGDGPGILSPFLLKKLNLNADQQASVQKIMDAHKPMFQTLFQNLRTAHEAVSEQFFTATPGQLKVEDLSAQCDQISKARQALMNEGLAVAVEIRNVLTADQLTQAAQLQAQMKALHEQMHNLMGEKQ